jgi:hypothetical protein
MAKAIYSFLLFSVAYFCFYTYGFNEMTHKKYPHFSPNERTCTVKQIAQASIKKFRGVTVNFVKITDYYET